MSPPSLDDRIRHEVYRSFVERGHPPVAAEIGLSLESPTHEVEEALHRLADAHALVLAPGTPYVWLANPFSALPSPYRVRARERDWWGICIWDALGIIALLGGDGRVDCRCPDCSEEMQVEVRDGRVSGEGIVHFAVPAAHWWDDIGFN